ncbi:MAG TPA: protease pro-enzyme activation domain-containing protein [Solirubrobacteraceae bacterium]|jgi:subtilase family serine protease
MATPTVMDATAVATPGHVRVGSTPVLPRGAQPAGSVSPAKKLELTIALQPRDPDGLQALATEVSTPGAPQFRQFLSVAQFASRFGASQLQIDAVGSALRAQGMDVGAVTANGLTLPVTGTANQIERAFSVSLSRVKLASGRTAFANAQSPTLPSSIARYVQGVIGLDNVTPDQPAGLSRQTGRRSSQLAQAASGPHVPTGGGPQPCAGAAAEQASHGLTADEVATAYQFPGLYSGGDFGAGQTIAMFEEQSYNPTDIATYQACYGTSVPISNVDVAGGPSPGGDDGESALDIEQAIGLAPKANILVYQGPFSATVQIISTIVSQNQAKVISSSYGLCEALTGGTTINAESPLLQEAAVQGQSFFISSGDSGSNMCYQATADQPSPDLSLSVIDPGGQPFATGVGGTSLFTNSGSGCPCFYSPGDPPTESVWTDPSGSDQQGNVKASGSGGGISRSFAMPSYQSSAPAALGVTNSNSSTQPCGASTFCREVPDVAADADPNTGYAIFSNGAWGITGGTSAAAPLWAAFTALVNASPTCRGVPVGFVNPALYQLAASSYLNNFTDVTTASPFSGQASNDALYEFSIPDNPNGLFPLASGYDMATGLGSMIAPHLASSLCSLASPVFNVAVASPGSQRTTLGRGVSLPVHASDSGGAALFYAASGLPPGLRLNAGNGVISGTAAAPGSFGVTVAAGDRFGNRGSTTFAWTVVKAAKRRPVSARSVSLTGLAKGKPKLSFSVAAAQGTPSLKVVSISLPKGLSFARRAKALGKGLTLKNGRKLKFKTKLKRGVLTISLKKSTRKASITAARPALGVSRSLASKVRRHKVKKLTVVLKLTDTAKRTTKLPERLKVK